MNNKFYFYSKILILFSVFIFCSGFNLLEVDSTNNALITEIKSFSKAHPYEAGLQEEIYLKISNAPELNDEKLQTVKVILFFEGMPLKGIHPKENTVDEKGDGELIFFIPHNDEATKLWADLLKASNPGDFFKRKVCVNVGLENPDNNQLSLVTEESSFTLVLVREKWFWFSVAILLVLLIIFLILVIKSDIIRDMGCNPPDSGRRPFSLARTQMAVWTFIIISSWLLLYVFQHTLNTITDSMAVLMGISSVTGIGSVAINPDKKRIAASQGFFKDILSDDSGISIHRFQIFAWTIVMAVVFCRQVIYYFEMPEFSASLLVLMGISSGTYLSYKFTEKPTKQGPDIQTNATVQPDLPDANNQQTGNTK